MASAIQKRRLSGSTSGMGILLTGISTAEAVSIHTATSSTQEGTYDEVWIYARNGHTETVTITIEYGGTTAPNQQITKAIPPDGEMHLVIPGFVLQNSLVVSAFASVASVASIYGFVNRITN